MKALIKQSMNISKYDCVQRLICVLFNQCIHIIRWNEHVRNEEVLLKSQGAKEYLTLNKQTEG
jgi:hypothetical protein